MLYGLRSSGLTLPSSREGVVGPDTVLVASDWIDRPVCDLSRSKSILSETVVWFCHLGLFRGLFEELMVGHRESLIREVRRAFPASPL